jgi:hypothetical protein
MVRRTSSFDAFILGLNFSVKLLPFEPKSRKAKNWLDRLPAPYGELFYVFKNMGVACGKNNKATFV